MIGVPDIDKPLFVGGNASDETQDEHIPIEDLI
jgi:hypothetical protein